MSLLKTIRAQLGLSVTPANNFTLDASADNGTMKLARGNAGATTQDVMTVDADGKVAFPQNPVHIFGGSAASAQTFATTADTKLTLGAVDVNVGGGFSSSRFTATVAGTYWFDAYATMRSAGSAGINLSLYVKKDTTIVKRAVQSIPGASYDINLAMSGPVDLAAGEYLELWAGSSSALTTTVNPSGSAGAVSLAGYLVKAA